MEKEKAKERQWPSDMDRQVRIKPDFYKFVAQQAGWNESFSDVLERLCDFKRKGVRSGKEKRAK